MQFIREDERFSISVESKFLFAMSKKVTKIDMEELSSLVLKHKVAWMSISDTEHVCGDALSCKRMQKVHVVLVETVSDSLRVWCVSELLSCQDLVHRILHH